MGSVDLFPTPPTQTSIMKRSTLEFYPIANVGDEGPIEFYIPPSDEHYLALNSHLKRYCATILMLRRLSSVANCMLGTHLVKWMPLII